MDGERWSSQTGGWEGWEVWTAAWKECHERGFSLRCPDRLRLSESDRRRERTERKASCYVEKGGMNNGGERSQSADMAQMEDGSCGGVVVSWMTTKRAGERMKMWPMTVMTRSRRSRMIVEGFTKTKSHFFLG